MAQLDDSIQETTPVMDDEEMVSFISSACKPLGLASSTVIATLGRLLLTSAKQDFSLKEHCESTNFKYIKYPDSFRACLVQVSNGVCDAFDAAHRSMKRISVKSEIFATDVKRALEFMESGTHQEWVLALHYLKNAKKNCLECVEIAAPITEQLEEIGKTIDELNEVLEKSDEAKKEYQDAAEASPSPWETVDRITHKLIDRITHFAINFAVELFRQTMIPQTQASTPKVELRTSGGPFTGKNESEKKEKKENQSLESKIKDALEEGIAEFLKVKKFWRQLKIMFQTFHDLMKDRLRENANKALGFGKLAEATNEELNGCQKISYNTRKTIIEDSKYAMKIACMVKWISGFYVEVSDKYLLVGVNGLQSFAGLRSSSGHARMGEVCRKLEEDAKKAEKGIPKIAEEREKDLRNEFSVIISCKQS